MKNGTVIASSAHGMNNARLIDHPIVNHFRSEVGNEVSMCPADDCDPCDYEAN